MPLNAAYDALTGQRRWRFYTQTGVVASPITYQLDGEQFIASGWGCSYALSGGVFSQRVVRLMVFKLGAKAILPDIPKLLDVSEEVLAIGNRAYDNNCLVCHGFQAYSSGLIPNLRYSAITNSQLAWNNVGVGGGLAEQGMPNFGKIIDDDAAEAIRAYVISEANSERGQKFYQAIEN